MTTTTSKTRPWLPPHTCGVDQKVLYMGWPLEKTAQQHDMSHYMAKATGPWDAFGFAVIRFPVQATKQPA